MTAITAELVREHNLSEEEYARILEILGREPSIVELGIFSAMWSEHCSYKSSRVHLKKFPTTGPRVIQGPGENAGVVDIGDGLAVAFKMESHNHPSFIEPYQGAATGVGGILRDVFTMGARPMASLNSLRFGRLDAPAHEAPGRRRGARDRRLRQLHRDPDARRRDDVPRGLRRQHPRQRHEPGTGPRRPHLPGPGRGRGQPGRLRRDRRPGGTASTARPWPPRSSPPTRRSRSARRCRSATLSPRSS